MADTFIINGKGGVNLSAIVGLLVAVIVFATILVPIVNDATTTERTFTNEGLYRMDKYDTTAEITATWDYTDPNAITVDDVRIELPEQSGSVYLMTITGSDNLLLRYGLVGTDYGVQLFDTTTNNVKLSATVTDQNNMTITIADGTASFNNGTSTVDVTYTDYIFIPSAEGEYVMKLATDNVYMHGDSDFCGIGRSIVNVGSTSTMTCMSVVGTINDGFTVDGFYYDFTTTNHAFISSEVNGYEDLYSFQGVTFTTVTEYNDTEYNSNLTYTQIIVPYEVTAELSQHMTSTEITIMQMIPVLVILAVIMGIAATLYTRKN